MKRGIEKLLCFFVSFVLICMATMVGKASGENSQQAFWELYLKLIETGDNSVQDVSDLNLPYMTCYEIAKDIDEKEGFIAQQCYNEYNFMSLDKVENISGVPYLFKFHMSHTDEGFQERYRKVKDMVAEVQANLDKEMSELDKVLWIHEYVVENIYYLDTNSAENHLGGPTLVNGYGVCEGYAGAMMIFLKAENIICETVSGGNHEWVAVKIDGEWYQIDPTWDDTSSERFGTHYFFMRNDEEFKKTLLRKHAENMYSDILKEEGKDTVSTSTKYTDWYIHDVWDKMHYYDGYWYYVLNNAVRKNNIQGTAESVLAQGTNMKIVGIEGDVLSFTCDGEVQEIQLQKEAEITLIPTATLTPVFTITMTPTAKPSETATKTPTSKPVEPVTNVPTATQVPAMTTIPMVTPDFTVTKAPTGVPDETVTIVPTATMVPTMTTTPMVTPDFTITKAPTAMPSETVTKVPTKQPGEMVTKIPTEQPGEMVTKVPTPTEQPNETVTEVPTPTEQPNETVTKAPTVIPSELVTKAPTVMPSELVTKAPTAVPTRAVIKTPTPTQKVTITKAPIPVRKVGKPVIKSVTNKKGKKVKIILKKKVSGAKGYEVAYSTNKKFKKSVKKVRFTGKSKTIVKLKKNRTYYIKVRAYKKDSKGKRVYGAYSKVKKIKIKK